MMYNNIFGACVGLGLIAFGIVGCCSDSPAVASNTTQEVVLDRKKALDYAESKGKLDFVRNARAHGSQGHIMYDIDRGTVTCIEHYKRQELACWKNGNQPVFNVEERTSYQ